MADDNAAVAEVAEAPESSQAEKKSKRQTVLDYCAAHPEATNTEVAAALGEGFNATMVSSIKSQDKKRKSDKPLDLASLKQCAPKIEELGGFKKVQATLVEAKTLVEMFGSIDAGLALCKTMEDIASIISAGKAAV